MAVKSKTAVKAKPKRKYVKKSTKKAVTKTKAKAPAKRTAGQPTKFFEQVEPLMKYYKETHNLTRACEIVGVNYNTALKWKEKNYKGFRDLLIEAEAGYSGMLWEIIRGRLPESDQVLIQTAKAVIPEFKDANKPSVVVPVMPQVNIKYVKSEKERIIDGNVIYYDEEAQDPS